MCSLNLFIGGLRFRLRMDEKAVVEPEIAPFLTDSENSENAEKAEKAENADIEADITVTYQPDDTVKEAVVTASDDGTELSVRYHPDIAGRFVSLRGCMMHIPMSRILLQYDRFFLHASFITSPWGGLLFTGDSGVGKSTQAELWKKYMGSTVINGDRAIVAKEKNGWRAYGSPYAGSSRYYVRQDEPVRAIILLEQAKENRMEAVSAPDAFGKLFLQVSLDHDSTDQVNQLCDLLAELIADIPVYRLYCTPDRRAVEVLRVVLDE